MFGTLKRFLKDRRGNFALVSVFAFPVIFAGVAISVDLSNGLRLRTDLQNANDTAALFSARYYQVEKKVPTTEQVAAFINANLEQEATNVKLVHDKKKGEFTVTSQTTAKPYLMNFFGNRNEDYKALSVATLGVDGILEFALALDTTWSMNFENRMPGLKAAANTFVGMLMDVKDQGANVRGSIVPFARYVNVGTSRRKEPWMDVPDDIDTRKTEEICNTNTPVIGWTNCKKVCWPAKTINHPGSPKSCWNEDGQQVCSGPWPAWTENISAGCSDQCSPVYGTPVKTCETKTTGRLITWHGCVGSRDYPWNVTDDFSGKKFPGLLDIQCARELQPLTDNRTVLLNKIASLTPAENTYIPEGIMWGIRTLTAEKPFTEGSGTANEGKSQVHETRKALILMTDGMNTIQASGKWHNDTGDATTPNKLTLEACQEAKDLGMEVYTVTFGDQVPTQVRNMLDKCATDKEMNFHASDNEELMESFRDIADNLLSVRLSQ